MSTEVLVQPREIIDLAYRITRVAGVAHGDAELVARWATRALIDGDDHLAVVVAAPASLIEAGRAAERAGTANPQDAPAYRDATRHGITIARDQFDALYDAAARFLVAETVLDEIG
ncbi:MAG: hypothetical protein AAGC53_14165 [Actinomycetota bacterium]